MSPRCLDLHILCTYGRPIGSILGSWPTFSLVVRFNASLRSEFMHRNVMVALRRPDRLCEIDLDVTSSLTRPIIEVIQKPCQVLDSIRIRVRDAREPPLLVRNALWEVLLHTRERSSWKALPFPSRYKFSYPPTISSSFTPPASQMMFTFHQMTLSLA